MTPRQLSAICSLFDQVYSANPDLGSIFYRQLSIDFPETREIFDAISMEAQHTRFVSMLGIILNRMKNGIPVVPLLQDLGRQHVRYGVRDKDFEKFGRTLIKVLDQLSGDESNGYLRDAWRTFFDEITQVMKSSYKQP